MTSYSNNTFHIQTQEQSIFLSADTWLCVKTVRASQSVSQKFLQSPSQDLHF